MKTFFITATGTSVGKTYVAAALAAALSEHGRSVRVLKPVISGFDEKNPDDSDTAQLLHSLDQTLTAEAVDACSPWRFPEPLSPDMAARREDRRIDFAALVDFCRDAQSGEEDVLLIEGIGGAMVPLDDSHTVLDWMAELAAPVLVIAGSYLGTLSHTLTTVAALQERDIPIAAVVVVESEDSPASLKETVETMGKFLAGLHLVSLARGANRVAIFAALKDIIGE